MVAERKPKVGQIWEYRDYPHLKVKITTLGKPIKVVVVARDNTCKKVSSLWMVDAEQQIWHPDIPDKWRLHCVRYEVKD